MQSLSSKYLIDLNVKEFEFLISKLIENEYKSSRDGKRYFIRRNIESKSAKEFLKECNDPDLLVWIYSKVSKKNLKHWTWTKAKSANVFRHRLSDVRSLRAIDTAIEYANGNRTEDDLKVSLAFAEKAVHFLQYDIDYYNQAAYYQDDGEYLDINALNIYLKEVDRATVIQYFTIVAARAVAFRGYSDSYFIKHETREISEDVILLLQESADIYKKHIPFDKLKYSDFLENLG